MTQFFIAVALGVASGVMLTLLYCRFKEEDQIDPHDPDYDYKDF